VPLRRPTADTMDLVHAATLGMRAIYRPGFNFAKAGVMLMDLQSNAIEQSELPLDLETKLETTASPRSQLMGALDHLNGRYGRGTVQVGSAGVKGPRRNWEMKQSLLTPQYTTNWQDVPVARA